MAATVLWSIFGVSASLPMLPGRKALAVPRGPGRDATEPGLVSRDGAHPMKERGGEQFRTHDMLKVVEQDGNVKAPAGQLQALRSSAVPAKGDTK